MRRKQSLPKTSLTKFLTREVDKVTGTGFVNTIKITGEDQVMLKVRVVEVQREVLKQFGVDLQALFAAGKFAFNLASIGPLARRDRGYKGVYTDGATSITGRDSRHGK